VGKTIRARFVKGRLEPAAPLDLAEGAEVTITVLEFPGRKNPDVSCRAAGAWRGTIAAEDLIRNIYADRLLSTRPEPRL
jgi:predicted DNA-binding antitoxin AbrB/MazE fold protein